MRGGALFVLIMSYSSFLFLFMSSSPFVYDKGCGCGGVILVVLLVSSYFAVVLLLSSSYGVCGKKVCVRRVVH